MTARRRGQMTVRFPAAARSSPQAPRSSLVPRLSTTMSRICIRPAPAELVGNPGECVHSFLAAGIDKCDKPRLSAGCSHPAPVHGIVQDAAIEADPVAVMPAGKLGGDEAIIDVGEPPSIGVSEIVQGEHHGHAAPAGLRDHPQRDRIAAVGEQDIRPIHIEELMEEGQDCLDFFGTRGNLPCRVKANDRDRHMLLTGIEHPRSTLDRRDSGATSRTPAHVPLNRRWNGHGPYPLVVPEALDAPVFRPGFTGSPGPVPEYNLKLKLAPLIRSSRSTRSG